jgi:flagellar biosynthetic protein FlhB
MLVGAAAGSLLQVGPMWAPEHLLPKLERISIIQGAQRLFSKRSVLEFLKGLLKLTIVGVLLLL